MAKSKEFEKEYKAERLRRTVIRKAARREIYKKKKSQKKDCGCGYWCFCGSNTPGVIDY